MAGETFRKDRHRHRQATRSWPGTTKGWPTRARSLLGARSRMWQREALLGLDEVEYGADSG